MSISEDDQALIPQGQEQLISPEVEPHSPEVFIIPGEHAVNIGPFTQLADRIKQFDSGDRHTSFWLNSAEMAAEAKALDADIIVEAGDSRTIRSPATWLSFGLPDVPANLAKSKMVIALGGDFFINESIYRAAKFNNFSDTMLAQLDRVNAPENDRIPETAREMTAESLPQTVSIGVAVAVLRFFKEHYDQINEINHPQFDKAMIETMVREIENEEIPSIWERKISRRQLLNTSINIAWSGVIVGITLTILRTIGLDAALNFIPDPHVRKFMQSVDHEMNDTVLPIYDQTVTLDGRTAHLIAAIKGMLDKLSFPNDKKIAYVAFLETYHDAKAQEYNDNDEALDEALVKYCQLTLDTGRNDYAQVLRVEPQQVPLELMDLLWQEFCFTDTAEITDIGDSYPKSDFKHLLEQKTKKSDPILNPRIMKTVLHLRPIQSTLTDLATE